MSAKFLHGFTDEKPELQRQIGCMTGIFQMFDRHHLLTGRRLSVQNNKRLPSGHALLTRSNITAENILCPGHSTLGKNLHKSVNEDRRVSMESSRTSFSSSSCSSFSSMDCSKSTQQDPSSNDQNFYSNKALNHSQKSSKSESASKLIHPEPSCDPVRTSIQSGRQSIDFRDVVKDSIYRDNNALSVKTSNKEEVKRQAMKHKDSPRSLQVSKSVDGSYMTGVDRRSRTAVDVDESLWVLVKVRESPSLLSEGNEPPRKSYESKDSSFYILPKETPRFSYDEREYRPSLDSRDNHKPSLKLRERPRLSLDSRSASLKNSTFDSKPNSVFKDQDSSNMNRRSCVSLDQQQELKSNACSPSVVVKLMGLEAMPNFQLGSQEHAHSTGNKDLENMSTSKLYSKVDQTAPSGNSTGDRVSPRQKSSYVIMKPISNAKVPIEVAPWRQQDKIHIPHKTTYGYREGHTRQQSESIYSKIEKRIKDMEFQQSNKDFRALKQIVGSIQAKGLLESKRGEDQPSETLACDPSPGNSQSFMSMKVDELTSQIFSTVKKGEKSPRAFETPIVIMKPVKSVNSAGRSLPVIPLEGLSGLQRLRTSDPANKMKTLTSNKMTEEQTPKSSSMARLSKPVITTNKKTRKEENGLQKTNLRMSEMSPRPQESPRENGGISMRTLSLPGPRDHNVRMEKSSNSHSPRLQQRKLELEKRSRPPLLSVDSNKPPKQLANGHSLESVSPRVRSRLKAAQAQQNDDQLSNIISETTSLSHQGDEISQRSDSNISTASQVDIEVTSGDSKELKTPCAQQSCESSGRKAECNTTSFLKSKKSLHSPNKSASNLESATAAPEQPSPISVLDASFCRDSISPPVKKHHHLFKGNENQSSHSNKSIGVPGISSSELSARINQKKFANVENLLEKLRQLSESKDEAPATDHLASLCETQNPNDRYVSEILLTSGFLMKDLTSEQVNPTQIQLHSLGNPINPDLFLVLEQRRSGWLAKPKAKKEKLLRLKSDPEKLHRKLVFDIVNELLIRKLELATPVIQINSALKTRNIRFPSGQRLLKELCSDIEQLRTDESTAGSDSNLMSVTDLLQESEGWSDFVMDLPVLVLEIERLIFKDLVDEVVQRMQQTSKAKQAEGCRKLLAK